MNFRFGRVPVLPLPCEAFAYFSYLTTSVRHKTKVKIAILTEAETANKASCRCFSRLQCKLLTEKLTSFSVKKRNRGLP